MAGNPAQLSSPSRPARNWVWFRTSRGQSSPAEKEYLRLPEPAKAKLWAAMRRYAAGESRLKDVDHLGGGLYEISTRVGNNPYRVLFFIWGPRLVALTAFYKNQRATPPAAVALANSRRTTWRTAFGDERAGGKV